MYQIVVNVAGLPLDIGSRVAMEIKSAFSHRPWHENIICTWDKKDSLLFFQADNDFDSNGLALKDEISDELSACINGDLGEGDIKIISVKKI